MMNLHSLTDTSRDPRSFKRVGRGIGSGKGKTCGRGTKGAGARSGYKRRYGYEGGQFRHFMKIPIRGFSNERFRRPLDGINLSQIERMFHDGDVVSLETLAERGYIRGKTYGIKILGTGELTKKVTINAHEFSQTARDKLHKAGISFSVVDETQ